MLKSEFILSFELLDDDDNDDDFLSFRLLIETTTTIITIIIITTKIAAEILNMYGGGSKSGPEFDGDFVGIGLPVLGITDHGLVNSSSSSFLVSAKLPLGTFPMNSGYSHSSS